MTLEDRALAIVNSCAVDDVSSKAKAKKLAAALINRGIEFLYLKDEDGNHFFQVAGKDLSILLYEGGKLRLR